MKGSFFVAALLAACLVFLASPGFPQDKDKVWVVETEGSATITNNDLPGARNKAINDALKNAVERAVAELVREDKDGKGSRAVRHGIMAGSDQYIHDFKISTERQVENNYVVNVRSTVFIGSLRDDLEALGLLRVKKNVVKLTEMTVTVRGLKSPADIVRVKEILTTKIKGVSVIHPRELAWGTAMLSVDFHGDAGAFSDELTKTGLFSPVVATLDKNYFEITLLKLK